MPLGQRAGIQEGVVGFAPLLRAFFCALGPLMSKNKLPHTKNYPAKPGLPLALLAVQNLSCFPSIAFLIFEALEGSLVATIGKNNDFGSLKAGQKDVIAKCMLRAWCCTGTILTIVIRPLFSNCQSYLVQVKGCKKFKGKLYIILLAAYAVTRLH